MIENKTKRKLRILLIILIFFCGQLLLLFLINIHWITYYEEEEVEDLKDEMMYFSYTHQNPDSGLFIEPFIDCNYRAIDSINFSIASKSTTDLIDPTSNDHLKDDKEEFFFDYLFDKQNDDGSFSDIGELGNMFSTYEVIEIIDNLDSSFLNSKEKEDNIEDVIDYLEESLEINGWGFKLHELEPEADIISTFCAINLAKRFSASYIINNVNISKFINATWVDGGYRYSLSTPAATPESTFYGIKAFLGMGMRYNVTQNNSIEIYFSSLYKSDGGYSSSIGAVSDVRSTYYALSSLYILNITPPNENKTLNYVINCTKSDGGFSIRPNNDINYNSDFISGWAGMNSISLIQKKNETLGKININEVRTDYYDWLYTHQGMNGLFGHISVEANYWGVLSFHLVESEEFNETLEIENIWNYIKDCYNRDDGGYSSLPNTNSTLFATYYALNIYQIFKIYRDISLTNANDTIDYLVDLQNSDGGFKVGNDFEYILSLYGFLGELVEDLIETEISVVESTYWAVSSLSILDALEEINNKDLMHWIRSAQSADGGFSITGNFHSDTISTYYGLQTFKVLNEEPMSKIAAIEFLKNAQASDGSFYPIPALSLFYDLPTSFLITYLAAKALYDYDSQPEHIESLLKWYEKCFSDNTGGIGDYPDFGGDLRNTPYGIILIDDLKYDQRFNPNPWNDLIWTIIISEVFGLFLIGLIKIISALNTSISKKLKERFRIGEKLNISYLQKFPAINCEKLSVYAGGKLIVDSVSMQLEHGKILGVLGESGAGKSTFVKALLGMRKYTGVSEIYGMDSKKNSKKIRPIYGYVPQDLSKIYSNFTTLQNIIYFGKRYDLTEKEIKNRAKRILRSLEIKDKTHEKVKYLSGGQKRRVSIAIALIHNPVFCVLDEPTSGLDPVVRENLWIQLTKINEQFNTTLIVITHYPEESRFCHKIAIFGRNRGMIDFGKPIDLLTKLPGKGRTIELFFNDEKENAVERLESIEGIEKVLENKVGTDFSLFSNLNLNTLNEKIKQEFPNSIPQMIQSDTKMVEYFRLANIEVPTIE
ncbi:MAG: prenyltransferase/squalene oxidase repeat-containing protein [Promethearchaeota archaeon]